MQASWDYTRELEQKREERGNNDGVYISGEIELAFEAGAHWADKSQRWKACAIEQPTRRGKYLAATKHGMYVAEFIPRSEDNEVYPAGWHIFTGVLADVTHWKQLPVNPTNH